MASVELINRLRSFGVKLKRGSRRKSYEDLENEIMENLPRNSVVKSNV